MPRGRKPKRGGGRHFTNIEDMEATKEREEREKQWRRKQGISDSDDDEEEKEDEEGVAAQGASRGATGATGAPGELPPSGSDEESDPYDALDEKEKIRGVQHLIEIENPNRRKDKPKKVTELQTEGQEAKPVLTRKQREDLEKQEARARYMAAHLAGKTEEARADMARLAIIRKQREEAAARKEAERKAKEEK